MAKHKQSQKPKDKVGCNIHNMYRKGLIFQMYVFKKLLKIEKKDPKSYGKTGKRHEQTIHKEIHRVFKH